MHSLVRSRISESLDSLYTFQLKAALASFGLTYSHIPFSWSASEFHQPLLLHQSDITFLPGPCQHWSWATVNALQNQSSAPTLPLATDIVTGCEVGQEGLVVLSWKKPRADLTSQSMAQANEGPTLLSFGIKTCDSPRLLLDWPSLVWGSNQAANPAIGHLVGIRDTPGAVYFSCNCTSPAFLYHSASSLYFLEWLLCLIFSFQPCCTVPAL